MGEISIDLAAKVDDLSSRITERKGLSFPRHFTKDLEPGQYSVYVDGRNAVGGAFSLTTICGPSLSPKAIDISLGPGETYAELKNAYLTPDIPKLDSAWGSSH